MSSAVAWQLLIVVSLHCSDVSSICTSDIHLRTTFACMMKWLSPTALFMTASTLAAEAVIELLKSCGPNSSLDYICRAFGRLLELDKGVSTTEEFEKVSKMAMRQAAELSGQVSIPQPSVAARMFCGMVIVLHEQNMVNGVGLSC